MSLPDTISVDGVRYKRLDRIANRVSSSAMYDCHLFRPLKGATVDELIIDWQLECITPDDRYGKPMLCPVIVLEYNKEIRRVGKMVFPAEQYRPQSKVDEDVRAFRHALLSDPDVSRLLAERITVTVTGATNE